MKLSISDACKATQFYFKEKKIVPTPAMFYQFEQNLILWSEKYGE